MSAEPSPPVHTSNRTRRSIRNVALAVIAAIAIAACSSAASDEPTATGTEQPTASTTAPSPTAASTTAPSPTAAPTSLESTPVTVEPTTATGFFAGGGDDVPVTFIVPVGWEEAGWAVGASDANVAVAFWDVANIYADPCQWVLVDPPVGPTVDDLASAMADVPDFDVTAAVDVTVDGYDGKQIEFTVPDYNEDECMGEKFGLWQETGFVGGRHPNFWAQGANQQNQMWILDVDGTRLVINALYFPNTSQQDRADLEQILSSIQIG